MRKILAGFVVALAIGIPAVYFGVPWWAEHKALQELDATLEMLRRTGAKASRGAVSYDLWTRTLKVTDLSIQPADPAKGTLKIRQAHGERNCQRRRCKIFCRTYRHRRRGGQRTADWRCFSDAELQDTETVGRKLYRPDIPKW